MTDLVMRKRAGRAGEIGLFVDTPVFEEDFEHIKMDADVEIKATTPRSLPQLKYAWAFATKIAEACDWLETKDDAMDYMLVEAKHYRRIYDPLRKVAHVKPKPTNFGAMDGTAYTRLLKRMKHVALTMIVPGLDETDLKNEIMAMIGADIPSFEETKAPPKRKPRAAKPSLAEGQSKPEGGEAHHEVRSGSSIEPTPDNLPSTASNGDSKPADLPPHGDRPGLPTNEEEYIAAARNWISKQTARHEDARAYFEGDHHVELRRKCGVSIGVRNMLRRELAEHYEKGKENVQGKDGAAAQAQG